MMLCLGRYERTVSIQKTTEKTSLAKQEIPTAYEDALRFVLTKNTAPPQSPATTHRDDTRVKSGMVA